MITFLRTTILYLAILWLAACRGDEPKRMPDTIPDISGTITTLTPTEPGNNKKRVQLLVEATESSDAAHKQASITITDDTLIEDANGKRLKAGQLQQGQQVDVWFKGAVRESMPVQATAKAVRVNLPESGNL